MLNQALQGSEKIKLLSVNFVEASITTGMTNRTGRLRFNQHRIMITIFQNLFYIQEVTTFLTLGPKAVLGTAKKGNLPLLFGFLICLFIHKTQHQYAIGL